VEVYTPKSFRLLDHCSVFQAEVHTIKEALNCLGNISLQRGPLNIYNDNQAGCRQLYSGRVSQAIRILSTYLAFKKENPPDALVRGLADECEKLRKGLVIGCDVNAHNSQWG